MDPEDPTVGMIILESVRVFDGNLRLASTINLISHCL